MKLAKNLERLGTESAFKILADAKKLEAEGNKKRLLIKSKYILL